MARKATPEPVSSEQETPGTDVSTVDEQDVVQAEIVLAAERAANFVATRGYGPASTALVMYIAEKAVDESDLNVVITEQLAERLLSAQSADDILLPFDPVQGKTKLGQPIYIEGCTIIESEYEGFPWYVSLRCKVPATGETYVLTTGGEKVVMQAAAADRAGQWPLYCKLVQTDKETKAGFRPLELRPVVNL